EIKLFKQWVIKNGGKKTKIKKKKNFKIFIHKKNSLIYFVFIRKKKKKIRHRIDERRALFRGLATNLIDEVLIKKKKKKSNNIWKTSQRM
ncbi:MAG: hypothetical protein KDD61_03110, partial [Bdellovibrionales bacterium]|nr:hypothetical protein [Bdellovibrionales bacterium]